MLNYALYAEVIYPPFKKRASQNKRRIDYLSINLWSVKKGREKIIIKVCIAETVAWTKITVQSSNEKKVFAE